MNFDSKFTEVCSYGFNWQYSSIGSYNGLAPIRRQTIIWTNVGPVHRHVYAALGGWVSTAESRCGGHFSGILKIRTSLISQLAHNAMITLSLRQNDVATSFWLNNGVIIASCVRGDGVILHYIPRNMQTVCTFHFRRGYLANDSPISIGSTLGPRQNGHHLQAKFSNAFYWIKILEFLCFSQVSNWQLDTISSNNGLAPNRQTIIWTYDGLAYW